MHYNWNKTAPLIRSLRGVHWITASTSTCCLQVTKQRT